MKGIMHKECSENADCVSTFEYNPRDAHFRQGSIFDLLSTPLEKLSGMLLSEYAGKTIDFMHLYEEHSVDRPYIKKNYKDVLRKLYDEGKVVAKDPTTNKQPKKGTFSDKMRITFGDIK
jgi:hypothetical protein